MAVALSLTSAVCALRDVGAITLALRAFDGHVLRDGDCAETTWVERADFATGRRFGNRARVGLARQSAARVNVVADAGYPGASRLRLSDRSKREQKRRDYEKLNCDRNLFIWSLLFLLKFWDGRQSTRIRSGHCCAMYSQGWQNLCHQVLMAYLNENIREEPEDSSL